MGGKGHPHQKMGVGLGGGPWFRTDLQLPGGRGSPDDPRHAGSRGRQGAGRAALTLRSPLELWCNRTPSTPTSSPRGGCSRSAPHTGIGRPPTNRFVAAKRGNAVFPGMGLLRSSDRDQSIWVGRGRPSKSPALMAMRAAHLAATRAAKVVKKNAVPAMSLIQWLVSPTLDQILCCSAAKPITIEFC